MHELSMAQGIINAVLETAEANNATEVNEVTVEESAVYAFVGFEFFPAFRHYEIVR